MQSIVNNIFSVNEQSFQQTAIDVFKFQYANNLVYKQWVDALKVDVDSVNSILNIPFLPVQFFKTHTVIAGNFRPEIIFESSGTTGSVHSKHSVKHLSIYHKSYREGFKHFYGDVEDWCIIGLLPSYLERSGSSLVTMVDNLIDLSTNPLSGFYLYDFDKLFDSLLILEQQQQKTLVIGVTFALLDFADKYSSQLHHTQIMETGGMKGRRKEMIRDEVHGILKQRFGLKHVHSEYGMTEMLSQAYAKSDGVFSPSPWMKALVRDEEDPLKLDFVGKGGLNIIDLANIYSCSFLATEDAGECFSNNTFTVNGRIDSSDLRGCSLMYT